MLGFSLMNIQLLRWVWPEPAGGRLHQGLQHHCPRVGRGRASPVSVSSTHRRHPQHPQHPPCPRRLFPLKNRSVYFCQTENKHVHSSQSLSYQIALNLGGIFSEDQLKFIKRGYLSTGLIVPVEELRHNRGHRRPHQPSRTMNAMFLVTSIPNTAPYLFVCVCVWYF